MNLLEMDGKTAKEKMERMDKRREIKTRKIRQKDNERLGIDKNKQ